MICDAAIVTKEGIDSAVVMVLEEDWVFGDTHTVVTSGHSHEFWVSH